MKGKYCIFYEEYGEGEISFGENSCEGRTRSRWTAEGGGEKTVNKVVVEKEDQSWNVSAVCKKKRDGVGGREGALQVLYYTVTGFQRRPKKSAVAIRALMKM